MSLNLAADHHRKHPRSGERSYGSVVIEYRHYRNCDPPGIVHLWRSQGPLAGRVQPLTTSMLEAYVLSKPYFDHDGMIVAVDQDQIIGMIHAGFGPDDERTALCHEMGVICQLLVAPHLDDPSLIAAEMIERAEAFLRSRGAKLIYAGGIHPLNPFYLGLYGGSESPGVLAGDVQTLAYLKANGYQEIDQVVILERELCDFRAKVDRKTLQVRRKFHIEATFDPPLRSWWDACTYGHADRTRFVLRNPAGEAPVASVTFWDMEPLAASWGVQAVGLVDLSTTQEHRRQGLATFLVGEALRQLQAYGVSRCQVQAMSANVAALGLYEKLGFVEVDRGIVLRKSG